MAVGGNGPNGPRQLLLQMPLVQCGKWKRRGRRLGSRSSKGGDTTALLRYDLQTDFDRWDPGPRVLVSLVQRGCRMFKRPPSYSSSFIARRVPRVCTLP